MSIFDLRRKHLFGRYYAAVASMDSAHRFTYITIHLRRSLCTPISETPNKRQVSVLWDSYNETDPSKDTSWIASASSSPVSLIVDAVSGISFSKAEATRCICCAVRLISWQLQTHSTKSSKQVSRNHLAAECKGDPGTRRTESVVQKASFLHIAKQSTSYSIPNLVSQTLKIALSLEWHGSSCSILWACFLPVNSQRIAGLSSNRELL